MLKHHVSEAEVMRILRAHVGRRRAIQGGEIARRLGLRGRYADRPVRAAIRELRRDGKLILSTTKSPPGYFLAVSADEWRRYEFHFGAPPAPPRPHHAQRK